MTDSQQAISTRERILKAAAQLFANSGYNKVTTRQIASAIGINAASIYYHFASKEEILISLYEYYTIERTKGMPDLGKLMKAAEIEPPREVMMQAFFYFPDDIREFLDHIIATAAREIGADDASEQFIRENIFNPIASTLIPLIERMVELDRIEPLDIPTFIQVLTFYCYSAASLNNSAFRNSPQAYESEISFLLSLIIPK
ncbi:MAG: TetR/AcrR family transcriptional regulator [Coriobacteriia bacterium]|nr:TetR/AcrR family transcriptional regulator [Coriobacteriia bacterium]